MREFTRFLNLLLMEKVKFLTNTSLWEVDFFGPTAIRRVLVVDPDGDMDTLPLMSTDVTLKADTIIQMYVDRWGLEVAFQKVREQSASKPYSKNVTEPSVTL